jgi:hypothetical protein
MTPEQMKIVVSEIQARHNPREAGLADFCRQLIGRIESLEIQLADEKAASARYAASLAQMPDLSVHKRFIELGCDVVKEARSFTEASIAHSLRDAVARWDENRRIVEAADCPRDAKGFFMSPNGGWKS